MVYEQLQIPTRPIRIDCVDHPRIDPGYLLYICKAMPKSIMETSNLIRSETKDLLLS